MNGSVVTEAPFRVNDRVHLKASDQHGGMVTAVRRDGRFRVSYDTKHRDGRKVPGGRLWYQPYQAEGFILVGN